MEFILILLALYLFAIFGFTIFFFIALLLDLFIIIFFVGLPGLIWSIVIIFILIYIYPIFKYRDLKRNSKLSDIVTLKLRGNKLIKTINSENIRDNINYFQALFSYILIGTIILFIYFSFELPLINTYIGDSLLINEFVQGERYPELFFFMNIGEELGSFLSPAMANWRTSSDFAITLTFSSIASIIIFMIIQPIKKMYKSIETKIDKLSDELKHTNLFYIDKISELENKMDRITNKLDCSIDHPYKNNIRSFIKNNSSKIVNNDSYLKQKVEREKDNAKDDYNKLILCYNNYQKIIDLAIETRNIVNQTGRVTFINQMDEIIEGLEGEGLKSLITKKEWSDYNDILSRMEISLKQLKKGAENYMSSSQKQKSSSQSHKKSKNEKSKDKKSKDEKSKDGRNISADNMNYEKALKIIGLPEGSSKKEILEVASRKVKTWHPDRYRKTSRNISKEEWRKKYYLFKVAREYLKDYYK